MASSEADFRASARRRSAKKRVRRVARPAAALLYMCKRLCDTARGNATNRELASSNIRYARAPRGPATRVTSPARSPRSLPRSRGRPFDPQTRMHPCLRTADCRLACLLMPAHAPGPRATAEGPQRSRVRGRRAKPARLSLPR